VPTNNDKAASQIRKRGNRRPKKTTDLMEGVEQKVARTESMGDEGTFDY
jgi:hypothetical protein